MIEFLKTLNIEQTTYAAGMQVLEKDLPAGNVQSMLALNQVKRVPMPAPAKKDEAKPAVNSAKK